MTAYDTIVIGAGHNGLVCATYLAKAGQRVLLLEAADTLGFMPRWRIRSVTFRARSLATWTCKGMALIRDPLHCRSLVLVTMSLSLFTTG